MLLQSVPKAKTFLRTKMYKKFWLTKPEVVHFTTSRHARQPLICSSSDQIQGSDTEDQLE